MKNLLETDRLILRVLDDNYWRPVLAFLEKGRHIFELYEASKAPLYYTEIYQKGVLLQEYTATLGNRYVRYYISLKEKPEEIIGTVSCGGLSAEPFSCGTLGYKFDEDYWHRGYAREAIGCVVKEIFLELKLHRVIAYVMESNEPSIKLLENMGFRMEGLCEKNIKVNGTWQNHWLYAMLNPYEDISR